MEVQTQCHIDMHVYTHIHVYRLVIVSVSNRQRDIDKIWNSSQSVDIACIPYYKQRFEKCLAVTIFH